MLTKQEKMFEIWRRNTCFGTICKIVVVIDWHKVDCKTILNVMSVLGLELGWVQWVHLHQHFKKELYWNIEIYILHPRSWLKMSRILDKRNLHPPFEIPNSIYGCIYEYSRSSSIVFTTLRQYRPPPPCTGTSWVTGKLCSFGQFR